VTLLLSASLFQLNFLELLPMRIEVSDAQLPSDTGLLPLRQFDGRIGLTAFGSPRRRLGAFHYGASSGLHGQ
jgi:hypothetical protein